MRREGVAEKWKGRKDREESGRGDKAREVRN